MANQFFESEKNESLDRRVKKAGIAQTAQEVQREAEKKVKTYVKPDDTVEAFEEALEDLVRAERSLHLGEAILKHLDATDANNQQMAKLIAVSSRTHAELLQQLKEKNAALLTPSLMEELLRKAIPEIRIVNKYPELFQEIEMRFAKLETEMLRGMQEQVSARNIRYNLMIGLLVAAIIVNIIFK